MEIVINDTNILIDLHNAGLLPYCKLLGLDFRTLDVILNEIEQEDQKASVRCIVDDGFLSVHSLTDRQVLKVYQKVREYNGVCNLSPEDISVMVYAQDLDCRLLTGDKVLRVKAANENIKVSGILYLTDMMVDRGVVSKSQMIVALQRLLESNSRLPKRLINERIVMLKEQ